MPSLSLQQSRGSSSALYKTEQLSQPFHDNERDVSLGIPLTSFQSTYRLTKSVYIETIKLPRCLMSCTVPRHRLNAIGDAVITCHTKGNLYHKHVMLNIEHYLLEWCLCNGLRAKLQLPTFSIQVPIFLTTFHPVMDQAEWFFTQLLYQVCIKLTALCIHKCVGQSQFISLC